MVYQQQKQEIKLWFIISLRKTGYDVNAKGRLPDCLVEWSAKRLKEQGADAVKFLLYYDVDDEEQINIQNKLILKESVQNV